MIKVIGTFEHDSFPTHQSSLHTKLRELIFFKITILIWFSLLFQMQHHKLLEL